MVCAQNSHLPEFVNRKKRNGEILKQNKTPRDSKMAEGKKLNERKEEEKTNKQINTTFRMMVCPETE